MVERARLESVYTFTGIEGSNPSLSAKRSIQSVEADKTDACILCVSFNPGFLIKTGIKQPKMKPPRLVKGKRPHIVFYAPDTKTGEFVRVRIYTPQNQAHGHKLWP